MIKVRMDGLGILKGGQGKATVYINKTDMPEALALNESVVVMGPDVDAATVMPVSDVMLRNIHGSLRATLDELEAALAEIAGELVPDAREGEGHETEEVANGPVS